MTRASGKKQTKGAQFEYRLARLRYAQGSFVRRSIDVWAGPGTDTRQLAELDCIVVSYDPQLRKSLDVIECKTGSSGSKESDRVLWLIGVRTLTRARSVALAKPNVADPVRRLARQLEVGILDEATIAEAEQELGIDDDWWPGIHNPRLGSLIVGPGRAALNASSQLQRAGRFLFGSFWFIDDFARVKQLRRLFGLLIDNETQIADDAFQLGIAEATVLITVAALSIGAWRSQFTEHEFRGFIAEELSTGLGDIHALRRLLRSIDQLHLDQVEAVHLEYQAAFGKRIPVSLPSFEQKLLNPPEWAEAFADLSLRLWRRSYMANDLVRWIDLEMAKLLGADSVLGSGPTLFKTSESELRSAAQLVFTFLKRFWQVPDHVFVDLATTPEDLDANASQQPNLRPEGLDEAGINPVAESE